MEESEPSVEKQGHSNSTAKEGLMEGLMGLLAGFLKSHFEEEFACSAEKQRHGNSTKYVQSFVKCNSDNSRMHKKVSQQEALNRIIYKKVWGKG